MAPDPCLVLTPGLSLVCEAPFRKLITVTLDANTLRAMERTKLPTESNPSRSANPFLRLPSTL